jgi:hypothetical protein
MSRIAVARAISIRAHPIVLVLVAALIAASSRGATFVQLRLVAAALVGLGVIVLGFSWLQVRNGRWSHVDASAPHERRSLHVFLAAVLLLGSALLWLLTRRLHMAIALALSGALVMSALLMARWVKASLHAAFAAFATALVWPNALAVVGGLVVTVAVVWSRLALGRHVAADIATGLVLGAVAGAGYQMWGV